MAFTTSDINIYTADAAGLAALSAAVITEALSGNIIMCPVGAQIALLNYK